MNTKYLFFVAIFFLAFTNIHAQGSANEIVFAGRPLGSTDSQIYSMRTDGSGQVNLTNNLGGEQSSPRWSPDGSKIVINRSYSLLVMNADGTNQHPLLTGLGGLIYNLDWSPDGSKFVLTIDFSFEPSPDIFVANADGSNLTQLTYGGYDVDPDWSPDGSKIVFSRYDGNNNALDIYVMNADGTGQTNITNSPAECQCSNINPTWSPDGSKIAFSYYRDLLTAPAVIHTMNADGSNRVEITYEFTRDDYHPSWSPDGLRLVFSGYSYNSNYFQIYVVNVDGTNLVQVTNDGLNYFAPDWKRAVPSSSHQLSGRVMTSSGRGIQRVRLTLDDGTGNVRVAATSSFGYFRFENVPTGKYTVSVRSKIYSFTSRTVTVNSSVADLDFVSLENP